MTPPEPFDPTAPFVSVVVPVFDGIGLVERAIASLSAQTFRDWECLLVDDASTDASAETLRAAAAADARFRPVFLPVNGGVSAARNAALRQARGEWVAYLDQDDEFYPGYLARIRERAAGGADVLMSRYDLVEERRDHPRFGLTYTHDPGGLRDRLFREHIAVPLGVAHARRVTDHTGGFDERRPREQDSELWRRFAGAGAAFAFLAEPSGLYHIRAESASRAGPPDPPLAPRPAPSLLPWRLPPPVPDSAAENPEAGDTVAVEVARGSARHTLRMPAAEAGVVGQIFERGEYSGVPVAVLADPPTVVDVGGHCGAFAAYARLAWHPRAVVHSFEPYPPHVELLRRNTAAFPGVIVYPFGLAAADGAAELFLDPGSGAGNSTVSGLVAAPAGSVPVPMRDAAAVWDGLGLGEVDVLKIDAEGAEAAILERLGPRLARVRVVLVEYHTDALRRRVDALLPGHALFGAVVHSPRVGTLKYLRADSAAPPATPSATPPTPRATPSAVPPVTAPAIPARPRAARAGPPRVLFASYHCSEDPASGAALCTRDLFDLLSARGWACAAFTGPHLDAEGTPVGERLAARPGAIATRLRARGIELDEWRFAADAGYPVAVFCPGAPAARRAPSPAEAAAFADRLAEELARFRPDVVLTYGGDAASRAVPAAARAAGAKAVFWLHNYAYPSPEPFAGCDAVVVPSEHSREYHRAKLGLDAVALPGPWNWPRALRAEAAPKYVTFVNPEPAKGVFWFARIAEVLGRTRPDIPLLVVEGRGTVDWLARCGLDLGAAGTLRRMRSTPDPRRFYALSRIVLVPSLWLEALSRVAVEAMGNGIPVIGSGRGGLAEVLATGGITAGIPERFTPETRVAPEAADVAGWVGAIARLWDDPAEYARASAAARAAAARNWDAEILMPRWMDFLEGLCGRR